MGETKYMGTADRPINASSAPSDPSTLPEVMYSLSSLADLYEMGLAATTELDTLELYQHILTHMRRAIRADGACLLLYHRAQKHFIPIAQQGEKLPGGLIANSVDAAELELLSQRGPGTTLDSIQLQQQEILLVTLTGHNSLVGLVALPLGDAQTLLDERGLLLTYLGNVAGELLFSQHQRNDERHAAIEQERNRIARDLHDGVVQQIAFVLYKLEFIHRLLEQQQVQSAIVEMRRAASILGETLQELRSSIHTLRPTQLEQQSVTDAVISLIQQYRRDDAAMSIQSDLEALTQLPERLVVPIFRLLQESLANIQQHAHATEVTITMAIQGNLFVVEIHDNGIGISPQLDDQSSHMGLHTMCERVQEAGGIWQLQSRIGTGTSIKASFPLTNPAIDLTAQEQEILRWIGKGLTNQAIAQQLSIHSETVKTHVHHIMQKLQVENRAQIAPIANKQAGI